MPGSLLPNELVLSGSTIFNSGEIILSDGTTLYAGFNGTNGCVLHNFPNATLSGSGVTSVQAAAGALVLDSAETILCNYGTLQLGYGLIWTNSQTNVVIFNTLVTNATNQLNGDFTLPAQMTFIFTGPGLSQLVLDGPTVVLGTLQVGAKDPISQLIDMGTLEVDVNLVSNGVVQWLRESWALDMLNWAGSTISRVTINIDAGGRFNLNGLIGQEQLSSVIGDNAAPRLGRASRAWSWTGRCSITCPGLFSTPKPQTGRATFPSFWATHPSSTTRDPFARRSLQTTLISRRTTLPLPGPIMVNTGLMDVEAGRVLLYGSTNSSQINVAAGAQVRFYASTNTLLAGTSFTGAGTIAFGGGTVILNANVTFPNLIADAENAIIKGSGNLIITSFFNWLAGTLQGPGALNDPGASLTVNSGYPPTLHRTLNNSGATTLVQGTPLGVGLGSPSNNLSGGIFLLQPASAIAYDGAGLLRPISTMPASSKTLRVQQPTPSWPVR